MDTETEKLMQEQFTLLPETIKKLILSSDFEKKIRDIANKNRVELYNVFENETLLLCMGLVDTNEYKNNITESLSISPEAAEEVEKDVHQNLIAPIESDLMDLIKKQRSEDDQKENNIKSTNLIQSNQLQTYSKQQNQFLPPLSKQSLPTNPTSTNQVNGTRPQVTSALAAEISNLLNQQPTQVTKPGQENTTQQKTETAPSQATDLPPTNLPVAPTSNPFKNLETQAAQTNQHFVGMNKMSGVVQKPRTEIDMVKTPPPEEGVGDPYREPV